MHVIPADLVEDTWKEISSSSPAQGTELINRIGRLQNDLLSFILAFTEELGKDAHELAIYMFAVIYRIFEKGASGSIRHVKPKEIMIAYEANQNFFEQYIGAHERFLEKAAEVIALRQPFVMGCLVETLFEAPENEEDPLSLSEEETGEIFLTLKTAIDVLDDAGSHKAKMKRSR